MFGSKGKIPRSILILGFREERQGKKSGVGVGRNNRKGNNGRKAVRAPVILVMYENGRIMHIQNTHLLTTPKI